MVYPQAPCVDIQHTILALVLPKSSEGQVILPSYLRRYEAAFDAFLAKMENSIRGERGLTRLKNSAAALSFFNFYD